MKPPAGMTLLIGGARSGKSALAVRLADRYDGAVVFVATAAIGDDDMARRIQRHRDERPTHWTTIENPLFAAGDIASIDRDSCVIVDCLTLWANEWMLATKDDAAIVATATSLGEALAARTAPSIVITNEVGLGIVPLNALARRYRDVLGNVNRAMATVAAQNYFVSCGQLLRLQRPEEVFS